jgi:hypothetical protein
MALYIVGVSLPIYQDMGGINDMFELSQERELEISGKIVATKRHEEIQGELSRLYDYIEDNVKDNKGLLEAFRQYEDLNLLMLTLFNEKYYREGFKDGVSLYKE